MTSDTGWTVLAPPDTDGLLASAALIRQLGPRTQVKLVSSRELSRRVAALADEPGGYVPVIVDLLPADSVDTLLVPAFERFAERGPKPRWIYGRPGPPVALHALACVAELVCEQGTPSWRLVVREHADDRLAALAGEIEEESSEQGRRWATMLAALSTSWDWPRLYRAAADLARLGVPDDDELEWARRQLREVERGEELVRAARQREAKGRKVAVVAHPTLVARVRPEAVAPLHPSADAVVFPSGPGRVVILATREPDLSFLDELQQLPEVTASSVAAGRLDLAWKPGKIPDAIRDLLGEEPSADMATAHSGQRARLARGRNDRIAKGLHPERLHERDQEVIKQGMDAAAGEETDG